MTSVAIGMVNSSSSTLSSHGTMSSKIDRIVCHSVQTSSRAPGEIQQLVRNAITRSQDTSSSRNRGPPSALDMALKVITAKDRNFDEKEPNPHHPLIVSQRVMNWVHRWGRVVPVAPEEFLQNILRHRGYDSEYIKSITPMQKRYPTEKQILDYDNELVWSIRNSDLPKLKELYERGKCMTACNRYSESIVHMACRRANIEIIQFLLTHGADFTIVDDYGRTPLHDACWRPEPRFDIVTMLLDHHLDLIRHIDVRGFIPLNYVREEHWTQWCAYLYNQIEKYWAPIPITEREREKRKRAEMQQDLLEDQTSSSMSSLSLPGESDEGGDEQQIKRRKENEKSMSGSSMDSCSESSSDYSTQSMTIDCGDSNNGLRDEKDGTFPAERR